MSFKYNQHIITLENYRQIFNQCSPDILDEIRSAILDDTQISAFIEICGNDSYKLGQLRMAIREFLPKEYLNYRLTGRTMYYIRNAYKKGLNTDSLLKYITPSGLKLEASTLELLAEMVYLGVDIHKVDFTKVSLHLVDIFCKGLYKGYPMWLCVSEDMIYDEQYIKMLMRAMQLGIDIHPFIGKDWNINQLQILFLYAQTVPINELIQVITPKFNEDVLTELVLLMKDNIPITQLVVKDIEGYPVYNAYQIAELGKAIEDNTLTNEMLNPALSDMEIAELHREELAKQNRKLNITLQKNI